jgi:hypothetical protein
MVIGIAGTAKVAAGAGAKTATPAADRTSERERSMQAMYATIRRYQVSGGSIDDLARAGQGLGAILSQTPGFVAAVAVEVDGRALVTIDLFDDGASLAAAETVAERWTVEHRATVGARVTEVATGEVVAQKGL